MLYYVVIAACRVLYIIGSKRTKTKKAADKLKVHKLYVHLL